MSDRKWILESSGSQLNSIQRISSDFYQLKSDRKNDEFDIDWSIKVCKNNEH